MTRTEHLLVILMEECNEVAQRASKALRFGLREVEPGQELSNAERINLEYMDLITIMEILTNEDILPWISSPKLQQHVAAKSQKVEKFLVYSGECGTLQD